MLDHEILIVYDHDNDSTIPIIKQEQTNNNNLVLIKNNIYPGPSGAIRTGFSKANAPVILVTMADLSDQIVDVDELVSRIPNEFGVISFSRFCKGGKVVLNKPDQLFTLKRLKHSLKVLFPKIAGKLINLFTKKFQTKVIPVAKTFPTI